MNISSEQAEIIESVRTHNVIVDSIAGCGKTTCILQIAKQYPEWNILLLTYNKRLQAETKTKAIAMDVSNIEIYTYHGFAYRYYGTKNDYTDRGIEMVLQAQSICTVPHGYHLLVLDEAQDLIGRYFLLACKIYKDTQYLCKQPTKFCVFGDVYQTIYGFNGADSRFLTLADCILPDNTFPWKRLKLSVSFRITKEIASFVNTNLLGFERMSAIHSKGDLPIYYYYYDQRQFGWNSIYETIVELLTIRNYNPSDIFILANSVKHIRKWKSVCSNPIAYITNRLEKEHQIPICVSNDNAPITDEMIKHKLVVTTFHQSKGLERKIVFIYGFDNSLFQYYLRDHSTQKCPNILYVAATRAQDLLFVLHSNKKPSLPFLKGDVSKTCHIPCPIQSSILENKQTNFVARCIRVTELVSRISVDLQLQLEPLFRVKILRPAKQAIDIPTQVEGRKYNHVRLVEDVSGINGIAIPLQLEFHLHGTIPILEQLKNTMFATRMYKKVMIKDMKAETLTRSQLLFVATCWEAYQQIYEHKITQLHKYNWITTNAMKQCVTNLLSLGITKQSFFECPVFFADMEGIADCIDYQTNTLYEFKCTKALHMEHYLQVLLYKYLFYKERATLFKTVVYNVLTDELVQVKCSKKKMEKIVSLLVHNYHEKKHEDEQITDEEFITQYRYVDNDKSDL